MARDRYSTPQVRLHWAVVALVALQYFLHDPIATAFDQVLEGAAPAVGPGVGLHIFGGFLVFALTLFRLQLRLTEGVPAPDASEPRPLQIAASVVHWAFYALLVALPVSGAVAWFRQSEDAGDAHEILRALLLGVIVLHVAGALVHRFVWKTDVMQRMMRPMRGA